MTTTDVQEVPKKRSGCPSGFNAHVLGAIYAAMRANDEMSLPQLFYYVKGKYMYCVIISSSSEDRIRRSQGFTFTDAAYCQ